MTGPRQLDAAAARVFRIAVQQLDRSPTSPTVEDGDCAVLDLGVQDTGADGADWALANRGFVAQPITAVALVWGIRGAPHLYRRRDLEVVRRGLVPFSEKDAASRLAAAAAPLRAAGIPLLDALQRMADELQRLVVTPMVKGDVSAALAAVLEPPYLHDCRTCRAVHPYELTFRLASLFAGLELESGSSPPVLRPHDPPPPTAVESLDAVRQCVRLLGPTTPKLVAGFLGAPVADVRARWPSDTVDVVVDGERRHVLAECGPMLDAEPARGTRLLGPYDPLLQARDRELLVPDQARRSALWPALGRPGAVLHAGGVIGSWRPRSSSGRLRVLVELFEESDQVRDGIVDQAERLASARGARLQGVEVS